MENKMEHEIENGQLIISFYGEIDGYNVAYYRNKLNVLLAINDDDVILILSIRLLSIVQG